MSGGNPEFKRWLALYFIEKGNWKLTDKAIEEFGQDATPRQTMEFAEDYSDKERDERTEYRVGLTAKEKKRMAHMKVADMIDGEKTEELYDRGYITNGRLSWKDKSVRATVVRKLVEVLDKDPRDLTQNDLYENRLWGLMANCKHSPYKTVKEAFPETDIKPWEMKTTPKGFYKNKENRVAAVKWLVEKCGKDLVDITQEDFNDNRLGGLLVNYYDNSPYKAIKEAYPERNIKPWEMKTTPMGFYDTKENRKAAVEWLVEKLKKDPRDLTNEDFHSNRLAGLLGYHYNSSQYEAVKEAFPGLDIKPWEMAVTPPRFFDDVENRIAAVKWLVDKLKKDPRDLKQEDFHSNRLRGLSAYYKSSPYVAVKEAFPGLDIKPWEMAVTPPGFFDDAENRIAAVKWLVEKLKKDPRDLTKEDFYGNRLVGLLCHHYNHSPYKAVKETGLVNEIDEKYMRRHGGARFRDDAPSSKQACEAAKKMERNAEKKQPVKGRDKKVRV